MSHGKTKGNPFTKILGVGTFALLGLVAVTTFTPAGGTLSASSLLDSLTALTAKVGTSASADANLSAAQGMMQQAVQSVSPSKLQSLSSNNTTTTSTTTESSTTTPTTASTHTNTKLSKTP